MAARTTLLPPTAYINLMGINNVAVVEGLTNPPRKKTQLLDGLSNISLSERQRGPGQQAFKHMATLPTNGPQQWTQKGWLATYLPHATAEFPPM